MRMNTKKRIEQLIEEILTEIDVEASYIDIVDEFCTGVFYGIMDASRIVEKIGRKYLKEEEGT